jgi:hypothetical protein
MIHYIQISHISYIHTIIYLGYFSVSTLNIPLLFFFGINHLILREWSSVIQSSSVK